jgi:hypothetical protein
MNKFRHGRWVSFGALLYFSVALFFVAAAAQAAFLDTDFGVRPTGMGGAFSAIADDSNAPLYNPAGLVQVQWNEFSGSYGSLFSGLDLYSGQGTSTLGQSYLAFATKPSPRSGSFALSWASFTASHLYREDTYMLSYARNVGDFFPVLDNALALGVTAKYLHRSVTLDSFSSNDPVFANGDTAGAFTADVGLLFKPEEGSLKGWRMALVGQNITQPNVGFQATDSVPEEWRLGFAYQSGSLPWFVPALDLSRQDGVNNINAGAESWLFHDTIGVRAGINRDEASTGLSYYQAVGGHRGFRLDYSFTFPYYVEGTSGSHRLALTVYF